jgi:D-alanyl-lipoteichoic acid acyltransferase DltB (MBOAT superfamily)
MSYTIDVYRRNLPATCSFRDCLFVSFFPQLVARSSAPGVHAAAERARPLAALDNVRHGLERFLRGFVKKTLFATRSRSASTCVRASARSRRRACGWSCSPTGQIYYDFSGYTDMAADAAACSGSSSRQLQHPYLSRAGSPSSGGAGHDAEHVAA